MFEDVNKRMLLCAIAGAKDSLEYDNSYGVGRGLEKIVCCHDIGCLNKLSDLQQQLIKIEYENVYLKKVAIADMGIIGNVGRCSKCGRIYYCVY